MSEAYDEISLRDLYLIIKRGLPLILAVTLVSAVAAFLYISLRSERYQAETTVLINPTPVRVQGTRNLGLDQRNDISWETYQTIAFSRTVLEDALARLGEVDISVQQLKANGEITRLVGPQRPDEVAPLTVSHAFTHTDPQVAAIVADAWSSATVATVSASMLASLETVRQATEQQLENLEERLTGLEERWLEFQAHDESELIEARLLGLGARIPGTEATLESIERQLAATQASRQTLAATGADARQLSNANPQAALSLLQRSESSAATGAQQAQQDRAANSPRGDEDGTKSQAEAGQARHNSFGLLPEETISEVSAALLESGAAEADLVTLVRQVELQRLTAEQAGLSAQRDATEDQLERMRELAQELRERQAGMVLERDRLEQQLETAREAHGDLANLEPVIEFVYQLAPTNSRILSEASIPTEAVGPSRLLVTLLAGVVGGMLALLYVFLRAAVSEPAPARSHEQSRPSPAH